MPVRPYTEKELKELKPFLEEKRAVTEANLSRFCKKWKRNYGAVNVYVHTHKNSYKKGIKNVANKYSDEQKAELVDLLRKNTPINNALVKEFSTKHGRDSMAVQKTLYRMRKKNKLEPTVKRGRPFGSKNKKSDAITPDIPIWPATNKKFNVVTTNSEFIVKIKDWYIKSEDNGHHLVFKF